MLLVQISQAWKDELVLERNDIDFAWIQLLGFSSKPCQLKQGFQEIWGWYLSL